MKWPLIFCDEYRSQTQIIYEHICNLENERMISVHFQGKSFNITEIQVYAQTSNTKEAEVELFYDDEQDLLELTPKKEVLFIIGGLECKSRKSRNTWSVSLIWPGNTE